MRMYKKCIYVRERQDYVRAWKISATEQHFSRRRNLGTGVFRVPRGRLRHRSPEDSLANVTFHLRPLTYTKHAVGFCRAIRRVYTTSFPPSLVNPDSAGDECCCRLPENGLDNEIERYTFFIYPIEGLSLYAMR